MQKTSSTITSLLLFGLVIICSSCDGQAPSKEDKNNPAKEVSSISFGDPVSEMDKGIIVIFQDQKNNYWFGSKEQGGYKYDGKNLIHFTIDDGLCDNRIRGIQEDRSGNIFFNTGAEISKFDGQTFNTLIPTEGKDSNKAWQLKPGDLWFEGKWEEDGLYRYDGKSLYHLKFPKHQLEDTFYAKYPNSSYSPYDVYKIYKDRKGNVWLGTSVLGVCRFDGKSLSWISEDELTELDDGPAPGVRSILEDKDGHFWFSANVNHKYKIHKDSDLTQEDGFHYEPLKGIDTSKEPNMPPYFMAIAEDGSGAIWMVTYDSGVWKYDGETLTHYPVKVGDTNVLIFTIYKDNQGGLWLGTHNAGVLRFNGFQFVGFNP